MSLEELRAKLNQPSVPDEETTEDEIKEGGEGATEPEKPEEPIEEPAEPVVEQDPPRVPYSRFETVQERAIRAEEALRILQENQDRERLEKAAAPSDAGLPTYWVKLYGDSEASKEAYDLRQQELQDLRESLKQDVRQGILSEQAEAEQRTETMVDDWSNQIDDYAAEKKRKFSEADTDAILDVMDELTPKDDNDNYIVEPIQYLPQAVELYDLRTEKALASKKTARQDTTRLTSAKSEGTLVTPTKEWDGDWRKKLARLGQ